MVRRIIYFGILGLAICSHGLFAQSRANLNKRLAQVNKDFTYRGKAIHPRAVKDLTSWVADPLPGPVAIDVAGTFDTNRYFGDYEIREDKYVFIDLTQESIEDTGWFSYQYLGRLLNGLHILRTSDNGGGTGIFQSLLLVECMIDYEYIDNGRRKSILMLRRRGEFGLGDRYEGKIFVDSKHNRIDVGSDKQNISKAYSIAIKR